MLLSTLNDPISVAVALLVGGVFLLLGVAALREWFKELGQARATRSWPQVTGRVLHVHVLKGRSSYRLDGRSVDNQSFDPLVEYEYAVNGVTYQGHRLAVGIGYSRGNRREAQRLAATYRAGAVVTVFYDPADPSQAVLEHGLAGGPLLPIVAGLTFFLVLALLVPWDRLF